MKKLMITTFIAIVILAVSCKKSRQSNANITYTNINKTITRSTTNIDYILDIDKDGLDDMKFRFDLVIHYHTPNNPLFLQLFLQDIGQIIIF